MVASMKDHIYFPLTILKIGGLFTEEEPYHTSKIYYYGIAVNVLFSGLFSLTIMIKCFDPSNDFQEFADSASTSISVSLVTIKSYFLLRNMPLIQKLCKILQEDDFQLRNERQKKTTRKFISTYKALCPIMVALVVIIVIVYASAPIFSGPYREKLPVPAWFPWDYRKPMVYEIVFFHQGLTMIYFACVTAGCDPLLASLMGIVSVECQILCDNLRNFQEFGERKLSICMDHHKKLLSFSDDLQALCNVLIFLQFSASGISVCFSLVRLSALDIGGVPFWAYVSYVVGIIGELAFYCWYGNEMIENSLEIANAAFESGWEDASLGFRKDLLFFLMRTQKPMQIYALNFFVLSVEVFKWILKSAWSCFTVLRKTAK